MKSLIPVCLLALALFGLTGCPDTGIVCMAPTVRCGQGCIDPTADSKNCGGCGTACRSGEICAQFPDAGPVCTCSAGTELCNGECTVFATDPRHCGGCTVKDGGGSVLCDATEVCEQGSCRGSCPTVGPFTTQCGSSCVDLNTDPNNCGACAAACENSQSCHSSHCSFDLVAACSSSGQLVGLQQSTEFKGPAESLGSSPIALATYGQTLLVADWVDQKLYEARTESVQGHAFAKLAEVNNTGNTPNQVVVDEPYVYVVNAGSGTLQVLQHFNATFPDGGAVTDGGAGLVTVKELVLGLNTYPEGAVKVGTSLWVPLYGGFYRAAGAAGQKVVRIDVTDPANPSVVTADTIDLTALDLKPFDGGTPMPRPYAIAAHRGSVYVALSNLNGETYAPDGPGLLAKINPTTRAVSVIDLGADQCLNPLWLASDGTHLLVSCGGAAIYNGPPNYELVSTDKQALVLLDENDVRQSVWVPSCPAAADGGSGCAPILLSRFAISARRVYVGDQNGGRLFVLDIVGNTLTERRGYSGDAGAPIPVCTVDPITHVGNVYDVLAVP